MAQARFRLGPLRLLPYFTLENVGWTNNVFSTSEGPVDDYTATVTAGTRLIVPFGRKVFLRGTVAPSYDWYYETEDLRSFGGTYSGEVLGLFNRVTVGAGGGYDEGISTVSSEVGRDVFNTTSTAFAKAEIGLFERLSLFGGAETAKSRVDDAFAPTPGLEVASNLDRTETAFRAGVRYAFSSTLSLGVMGEEVQTRFVEHPELQDNDVRGALFVVRYDRDRFYLEGAFGVREGKPANPNEYYPEFRTGTYGYFASWFVLRPLELQARGWRRPYASLFVDNPYYFETANGLGLRYALGRRVTLHAEGSLGSNRYVNPVIVTSTGEVVTRVDDLTRWGAGFELTLSKAVRVGLGVSEERWDSNIDFYDRKVLRVTGGLNVSAAFTSEERR